LGPLRGLGRALGLRLRRLRGLEHAQARGRQVKRDRAALLERERQRAPRVRDGRLQQLAADDPDVHLVRAAEEDGALDEARKPVVAWRVVRLELDPLGADHRLDLAAYLRRALLGPEGALADLQRAGRAVRACFGVEQVGDAEEAGDEGRARLLVDL